MDFWHRNKEEKTEYRIGNTGNELKRRYYVQQFEKFPGEKMAYM
jgi:hypothetical protein